MNISVLRKKTIRYGRVSMDGVTLHPLKQITNPKGDVYHVIKCSSEGFGGFGEAYFSTVYFNIIKGWKKHREMILNLIVPVGSIKIVLFDDRKREFFKVTLGQNNYQRLTVAPGIWMAFRGEEDGLNLLFNVASIEHNPEEAENCELNKIPYLWE